MKLTSVRLFGFKTFAEQTMLQFESGITAIVGPNGSGKSNVVDAIRWVLGEQSAKSLRSTKTEDVIFAGNERRKALGMAEITLTFDNDDGAMKVDASEVQITRRAYRAGESGEYFINRQQVRLRDVIDVLMGTGLGPGSYAIVSQGHIDAILSARPTERRELFEETSGVSRFLARKNESLRRLEQTEQNAIRLNDLLAEIAARIPELETQERRAKRYRKLSARLRDLEILSYLRASSSRRNERDALGADLHRLEALCVSAAEKALAIDTEASALRLRILAHEQNLENLRSSATTARARLAELEARQAALSARRDALEQQSLTIVDDRERAQAEAEELRTAIDRLVTLIGPLSDELEAERIRERNAQEAIGAARTALDGIYTELRAVEAAAALSAADEAERRAQVQALFSERDRLESEVRTLNDDLAARGVHVTLLEERILQADGESAELAERARAVESQVRAAEARMTQAQERLAAAQTALRSATGELAGVEARLHTIEELEANLEGHVPGTRAVLEAVSRGELTGIVGVVSQLVRVDQAYARALDVAFGAGLSNIVTHRAEDAERAIAYLRRREQGRATFLPLDVLGSRNGRDAQSAPPQNGVIGWAHTLVETEPEYRGLVAFLIGRTLVVETLDVGVELVRGRAGNPFRDSIVTLEGDEIRGGGAMTGGRYARERSLLSRKAQAHSLRENLPVLRDAVARAEAALNAASEESIAARRMLDETRTLASQTILSARESQTALETMRKELARLEEEQGALAAHKSESEEQLAGVRERLTLLDQPVVDVGVTDARRAEQEERLARARENIARMQEGEREISSRIAGLRERIATYSAQRDGATARVSLLAENHDRVARAREELLAEIAGLVRTFEEGGVQLEVLKADVAQRDRHAEIARTDRETMSQTQQDLETAFRAAQQEEREATASMEAGRRRMAEIDAELGMLTANFAQNPATAEECADVQTRYANDEGDMSAELQRLRDDLGRLSNVNLNAEAERLAQARQTLLDSIREIETSSQEQFNEIFNAVQEQFAKVYARLFPGGQAHIWQTDPDSLSETGIELSVQPPGKKMMNLAALSGGERAMAAAALIFALIKVRPSPFYLLDEVDAALDDANLERFSHLVREVASESQMLIVTHNKRTMELATRIYGVTMVEPGISSIIATDLTPIETGPTIEHDIDMQNEVALVS
jgi:chromosome segregation protein